MWVHAIVDRVCLDLGLRERAVFLPPEFGEDLRAYVEKEQPQFLLYGNADFEYAKARFVAAARPALRARPARHHRFRPFSHCNTHSTEQWESLLDYREKLQSVSKEEGLHLELGFAEARLQEIRGWRECPPEADRAPQDRRSSPPALTRRCSRSSAVWARR
ncbi:MAG: hypothetical protein R2748_01265 [Bryobacterales bacterium]